MKTSIIELNRLAKKTQFSNFAIIFKKNAHKLKLNYQAIREPYHEIELSYLLTTNIHPFEKFDSGINCILTQKNFFKMNYYEFFIKTCLNDCKLLLALTSNKDKLNVGRIIFGLQKGITSNLFNLVLEHNLKEKYVLLTGSYETNIEDIIILKNMVIIILLSP